MVLFSRFTVYIILNILDINESVDFENQTIEKQYITLLGCTSFENVTFRQWKQILQCVSLYIHKIRNLFIFDCRYYVLCSYFMYLSKVHYATKQMVCKYV